MTQRRHARVTAVLLVGLIATACGRESGAGQDSVTWQDPSKHEVRFVIVEEGVRLEVLDWGGSGRPVVLLAGSGHSAHVFDDFAPKLTDCCHVYGITRRGYGASSQPASGYDDQRLADDVLRVLDSLQIEAPLLVGHSMAGGELTTLGNQHSNRLGGLVYLHALGDPSDWPASDPAYLAFVRKLPDPPQKSPPCTQESGSFSAYRAWQMCTQKFAFPESELRSTLATNPDGTRGRHKTPRSIHDAIGAGAKKRDYSNVRVPVLAFFESQPAPDAPPGPDEYQPQNEQERAAIAAFRSATQGYIDRSLANLKRAVPAARLVDLPRSGHYVFLTREAEVLRELRAFVASLPNASRSAPQPKPRAGVPEARDSLIHADIDHANASVVDQAGSARRARRSAEREAP